MIGRRVVMGVSVVVRGGGGGDWERGGDEYESGGERWWNDGDGGVKGSDY